MGHRVVRTEARQERRHLFTEHLIADDYSTKNPGNVTFSEPHASTFADVDGDGIPDLIVGKRVYSHLESYTDPDPYGPEYCTGSALCVTPKLPAERSSSQN